MRRLFYMGLEPYEARYTLQLTEWSVRAFRRRKLDYMVVPGTPIDSTKSISVGQVLDAHGRAYFAMSQMMNLIQLMRNGEVGRHDCVFFEDMFHPGLESLGYIMCQVPSSDRPRIYLRCLAQSIDPDDFVHSTGMAMWMRHFERMCDNLPGVRFLMSSEEMVAHARIAGWREAPMYNISGLSFGKDEVVSRVAQVNPWDVRQTVSYTHLTLPTKA